MSTRISRIGCGFFLALVAVSSCWSQARFVLESEWVGAWSAAPGIYWYPTGTRTLPATTFRNIIRPTLGGSGLRIKVTNELGTEPLEVGSVNVAYSSGQGAVLSGTRTVVTFGGQTAVTIPAGAIMMSDRVDMAISPFQDLAVSIYIPRQPGYSLTYHRLAMQTNYQVAGNQAASLDLGSSTPVSSWFLLKGVDVEVVSAKAIVAYGDSITDGKGSLVGANGRWPDYLAVRLASSPLTQQIAVLNEGMGGDCLLSNTNGTTSALERFDRDVLSQSGAKYLIVLLGTNDINQATEAEPLNVVSATQLTGALAQILYRAHEQGIKVYAATITPAAPYTAAGQTMRSEVNQWIRTSHIFDAVLDFDAVVRNPRDGESLLPAYDSGDHVHLNDAGYAAIADSIDLTLFEEADTLLTVPQLPYVVGEPAKH